MNKKEIDCVEMKHRTAEIIGGKLRKLSPKERLSYWRSRYHKMEKRIIKMKMASQAGAVKKGR